MADGRDTGRYIPTGPVDTGSATSRYGTIREDVIRYMIEHDGELFLSYVLVKTKRVPSPKAARENGPPPISFELFIEGYLLNMDGTPMDGETYKTQVRNGVLSFRKEKIPRRDRPGIERLLIVEKGYDPELVKKARWWDKQTLQQR